MNRLTLRRSLALAAGLAVLAALLAVQVGRARRDSTWWIDESETALLAGGPLATVLDYCAQDTNPPGLFVLLAPWTRLGARLGTLGALWMRLPSVACWLLLVLGAWWLGRRAYGGGAGLVLAAAVALSPSPAFVEARAYGPTSLLLLGYTVCTSVLLAWPLAARRVVADDEPLASTSSAVAARPPLTLWALHVVLGALALWCHLLAAVVLALLAPVALLVAWRRRAGAPWLLRGLLLDQAAIAGLCLPWARHLPLQVAARRAEFAWYVSSTTPRSWTTLFVDAYPFGHALSRSQGRLLLGSLTIAAPLALALLAWLTRPRRARDAAALGAQAPTGNVRAGADARPSPQPRGARPSALLVALLLALPIAFAAVLFALQRFGGITVFRLERYPLLVLPAWSLGLAMLALRATSGRGWSPAVAALALLPWLASNVLGLAIDAAHPTPVPFHAREAVSMPVAGKPIYVYPSRLLRFHRRALAAWDARPLERLACDARQGGTAVVVDLGMVQPLRTPADAALAALVLPGVLADSVQRPWHGRTDELDVFVLRRIDPERAAGLCARGTGPVPTAPTTAAAAVAQPAAQRLVDGWWWLEADPRLAVYRWWRAPRTRLVFDRPLAPGNYVLHLRGYCPRHAQPLEFLGLQLPGSSLHVAVPHAEGEVALDVPLVVPATLARPELLLAHPIARSREWRRGQGELLPRAALRLAWLERVGT
jgi:hypothetical protein